MLQLMDAVQYSISESRSWWKCSTWLPWWAEASKLQHASAVGGKKAKKIQWPNKSASKPDLGMSDQIYRSQKVLGFWSISSSCQCRQTFGEHRRLAQAAALPAGLRSQFWLGNVSTRSRAKNGIGTDAGDRTIDDMPPTLFDNSCGNQITDG